MSPDQTYQLFQRTPDEQVRVASLRDPIVFAEANLRNEVGRALEFREEHAFQIQYMRDFAPQLCVIKSSQVGITTISIAKVLYLAHLNNEEIWSELFDRRKKTTGFSVIYTMPTANDVSDFSSARFKPMVSSSPLLVGMMGGKQGIDAVTRKKIGDSYIYFRGTTKEGQAISVPADLIVNDELDFSAPGIVEVLDGRLTHSDLKWWWKFSTPTIPNFGIDAEYTKSCQFHFVIRCSHCNKRQEVKYPRNVGNKKIRGKRIRFWKCIKCDGELDRTRGVWEARYPNREYHGYMIPPTICPWIKPDDITKSKKKYKSDKAFNNYVLGRAFSTGADVLARELMLSRMETGRPFNPMLDRLIFMGVDQGDVQHYVISRMVDNRREILKVGTTKTFDEIAALILEWNVRTCVMDALPNKVPATKMASGHYGRLLLAFYKDFDEEYDVKESNTVTYGILLDRTNTLDTSAASWRTGESVLILEHAGQMKMYDDPSDNSMFVQQMGNMTRDERENEKTGKRRAFWVTTGPDHYRHADNYNYVAFQQALGGGIEQMMTISNPVMTAGVGELVEIGGKMSTLRSVF